MEYKLSSFHFSNQVSREDKHHVIVRINSIRSRCPSDATFTGDFNFQNNLFTGQVKVLFSKGSFFVSRTSSNVPELMNTLLNDLDDQIAVWKEVRFDQPETFINYSEWIAQKQQTGS